MVNLRGILGIKRINRMPNARAREVCGVKVAAYEGIDENVPWWIHHIEIMENSITA